MSNADVGGGIHIEEEGFIIGGVKYNYKYYYDYDQISDPNYFPPGYMFQPSDEDLLDLYLRKKVLGEPLPLDRIKDVHLYHHNPEYLAANYQPVEENEWYFFTPRHKKYLKGRRPNRAAGDGYWTATGIDKKIVLKGKIVGTKKVLVFHLGKPPNSKKTNWMMHEYVSNSLPRTRTYVNDMRLDDWVLCKIYKSDRGSKDKKASDQHEPSLLLEECSPPVNNDNTPTYGDCFQPYFQNGLPQIPPQNRDASLQNCDMVSDLHYQQQQQDVNYELQSAGDLPPLPHSSGSFFTPNNLENPCLRVQDNFWSLPEYENFDFSKFDSSNFYCNIESKSFPNSSRPK